MTKNDVETPNNTQTVTQIFTGVPMRKLHELQLKGWSINGVSIQRTNSGGVIERGAVTAGGMVLWWNSLPSAPVQEPVAWYDEEYDSAYTVKELNGGSVDGLLPLYTTQPAEPAQCKPLTDEQIDDLAETHCTSSDADCLLYTFTTADLRELIEAAHEIKD